MYQGSEPMCIGVESDSQSSRPCGVEDAGAEVLRLADDRGVAHPEEHAGHLLGDRVERAAEHAQRDRVDLDPLARRRARLAADLVLERQLIAAHLRPVASGCAASGATPGPGDDDVPEAVDVRGEPRAGSRSSSRTG